MSVSGIASRCRSSEDYFRVLDKLIDDEEWESAEKVGAMMAVNGPHSDLPFLHIENYGSRKDRGMIDMEAFDQIACLHLHVLFHVNVNENYEAAYTTHTQLMQVFNKEVLQKRKEENWFMPVFYQFCSDLRYLAKMADELAEKDDDEVETVTSNYEECAKYIMEAFRTCVADSRTDVSITKRVALLNMTNQLFRIYFKINKLNLLKPLIRTIENAGPLYDSFSMADKVTYNYFLGRKAMFDSDFKAAEKALSYAFRNCLEESKANKRSILLYLIPVKMFLGHMPTLELLHKYQLDDFIEVVDAVKEGNLAKLDRALLEHQNFFIQCGIFLMLEKLRGIAFRTLFKRVSSLLNTHIISLSTFKQILTWLEIEDVDDDELECIVANLIAEKKIKGYISHQQQKLVISKKEPFPALSTVQ